MQQPRMDGTLPNAFLPLPWPLGPRTTALLCSAAVVCTGYVLGMDWLARPVLALPAGLWLIAGAVGLVHARQRRNAASRPAEPRAGTRRPSSELLSMHRLHSYAMLVRDSALDTTDRLLAWNGSESALTSTLRRAWSTAADAVAGSRLSERLSSLAAHADRAPLHVGIDLRESELACLRAAHPRLHLPSDAFSFTRAPAGAFVTSADEIGDSDALVRRNSEGNLFVFVPEIESAPAAWYDWSIQPPLSFASVFPSRLDCARLSLGACDLSSPRQAELIAALAAAAAALGRSPQRRASHRWWPGGNPQTVEQSVARQRQALQALSDAFERLALDPVERGSAPIELLRAASNIVLANCATQEFPISADRRLAIASLAAQGFEREPAQVLRLAAVQFAAAQDDAGMRSLQWGTRLLRSSHAECAIDPLAFVQSEIELGRAGGLSTGRIAAGMALLWATTSTQRQAFLRDDLMDDLHHAGWLMGRDHDRATIDRVMNHLDSINADSEDHCSDEAPASLEAGQLVDLARVAA